MLLKALDLDRTVEKDASALEARHAVRRTEPSGRTHPSITPKLLFVVRTAAKACARSVPLKRTSAHMQLRRRGFGPRFATQKHCTASRVPWPPILADVDLRLQSSGLADNRLRCSGSHQRLAWCNCALARESAWLRGSGNPRHGSTGPLGLEAVGDFGIVSGALGTRSR
ncbi:hypothetical protein L226DRAFT_160394 [Lentinus tigrinus ALCF2SS1-7]|uniref:uncharacterized protein n=1 Tax=Lentinus tigrinus ALCF2SS1-7 TaxID=1328758 RepID=UPI0011662E6D|nr:hypothetical protein L226DRAFT_160394 [Lentinus tigrinus ALCF2SS1-7]